MALTKIPGNLIETGAVTGDVLADGGIATAKLADNAVTTVKISDANITHAKLHTSMDLTGKTVTVATAAGSTNTTAAASTAFVQQELTTLIGGAPGTLDTLNELAAAINDDDDYHTTLTTALATKLPLAGGTLTGTLAMGANAITSTGTITAASIIAGDVTSTTGDVLLQGKYGQGATVNIGSERSSGGVFLGYGVQPSTTTQHEFLSSTGNALAQSAYVAADTHRWWTASYGSAVTAGSQVTTMTQRMTILANGNVGIGRTDPVCKLEVTAATGVTAQRWSYAADYTNYALELGLVDNGSSDVSWNFQHKTNAATHNVLSFKAGNIGIGVTNPLNKFVVAHQSHGVAIDYVGSTLPYQAGIFTSSTAHTQTAYGDLNIKARSDYGPNYGIGLFTANSANAPTLRMKIAADGKVGIGTTSPSHGLTVSDIDGGDDANMRRITIKSETHGVNSGFRFDSESANGTARGGGYYFQPGDTDATTYLGLTATDAAYQMVITREGNVGIGTPSPTTPFEVHGGTAMAGGWGRTALLAHNFPVLVFQSEYGTDAFAGIGYDNSTGLKFYVDSPSVDVVGNSGANHAMTILDNKNVGIGTQSPDYLLDIENTSGNAIARLHSGTNGSSSLRLQNDAQHWDVNLQTNDKFAVYNHTAGTQPFTIMPTTGNVGIGTADPVSRLSVVGSIALYDAASDPSLTVTESGNVGKMSSGEINMIQGWSGTLTAGDTLVFTYNKASWAAYGFEIEGSNAGYWGKIEGGGYSNGGPGLQSYTNVGTLFSSFAITSTSGNSQGLVMTCTCAGGTHTVFRIRYFQSGGDGGPIASRATLDFNS